MLKMYFTMLRTVEDEEHLLLSCSDSLWFCFADCCVSDKVPIGYKGKIIHIDCKLFSE